MQINPPADSVRLLRIIVIFFHEYAGLRHAETVNALLHVADHEAVSFSRLLPGHASEQKLLDGVRILVFIDIDFLKIIPVLPCRCGGNAGPVFSKSRGSVLLHLKQNPQRRMLHIRKIQDILLLLGLAEAQLKEIRHAYQDIHKTPCLKSELLCQRRRKREIILPELQDGLL